MKFNTLVIDKLNSFGSVSQQNSKKSSLIQFSDIIKVCNSECSDGSQNPLVDTLQPSNDNTFNTATVVSVTATELKNILSMLQMFGSTKDVQAEKVNRTNADDTKSIKEINITEDQLQTFFSFVLSHVKNLPADFPKVNELNETDIPFKLTFDDGSEKFSITVSTLPDKSNEPVNVSAVPMLSLAPAVTSVVKHDSSGENETAIKSSVLNTVSTTESQQATTDNEQSAQMFKVEILKSVPAAASEELTFPVNKNIDKVLSNSQTDELNADSAIANAGEKSYLGKNNFDFLKGLDVSKTATTEKVDVSTPQQKDIPIEQILFGKNYTGVASRSSLWAKNVLQSLSNDKKSAILNSFSNGDVLSVDHSHETTKPLVNTTKIVNEVQTTTLNVAEAPQLKTDQQILKQATITNLPNEQALYATKPILETQEQIHELPVNATVPKGQEEKVLNEVSLKQNQQAVETVTPEKELSVKISVKDEKQSSKDVSDTKTSNVDNNKVDQQAVKDTQSDQHENKESAKHNSAELFKNSVAANSATAGADKTQFISELRTLPDATKTITKNEIIPEFSKVIQQGEKQTLTFQLSPENLGKVKLTVDMVANSLNAHIEVENDQVKQFIQSNVNQLKENLQSNGMHLSNVNVSLADYNQRGSKTFIPRKKYSNRYMNNEVIENTTSAATKKSMGYNTYEFLA